AAERVRVVLHPPVRGVVAEPVHVRVVLVHQVVVDRVRVHDARLLGDSVGSESSQALTSSTRTTGRLVGYRGTSWFVRIASQMTRSDIPVASASWSTRRDSGSPMWCSLWLGGGLVTPAHGVGVTCDGGSRVPSPDLHGLPAEQGDGNRNFVFGLVFWVPGVHGDIPAACAPRRARCLTSPASVRLSHDGYLWCGRMRSRPYQHASV